MNETGVRTEALAAPEETVSRKQGWFATGGVIGAILASTCCIAPLALLMLGVSGAWIGNLTALEPYKLYFATVALVFIGLGFRQVYFTPNPACADGSLCARPQSSRITRAALWSATVLVLLAISINWWAPLFY
jgi:mercuric ion transport protein